MPTIVLRTPPSPRPIENFAYPVANVCAGNSWNSQRALLLDRELAPEFTTFEWQIADAARLHGDSFSQEVERLSSVSKQFTPQGFRYEREARHDGLRVIFATVSIKTESQTCAIIADEIPRTGFRAEYLSQFARMCSQQYA